MVYAQDVKQLFAQNVMEMEVAKRAVMDITRMSITVNVGDVKQFIVQYVMEMEVVSHAVMDIMSTSLMYAAVQLNIVQHAVMKISVMIALKVTRRTRKVFVTRRVISVISVPRVESMKSVPFLCSSLLLSILLNIVSTYTTATATR